MKTTKSNKDEKGLAAREAIEQAKARGRMAVLMEDGPAVIAKGEAERLAAAGTSFAYLCIREGRIVTIPID